MTDSVRTMINFPVGTRLFNYRVAAVAIREGHLLTCREDDDDYIMLPGGRVELGESSLVALEREVAEELRTPATIERLLYTAENFFDHDGKQVHELAAYYLIDVPAFPFSRGGVVFEIEEDGHDLRFEWIDLNGSGLFERRLLPTWLAERLRVLPESPEHLILHETRR